MTNRQPITGPQDRFANLEGVRGESYAGEVVVCAGDGATPIDLTGYTLTLYLWEGEALAAESVCETEAADGVVKLAMSAAQTLAFKPIAYHFELWADNGSGGVKLILWGFFWFKGACVS